MKYLLAVLAAATLISGLWAAYERSRVNTLTVRLERTESDLASAKSILDTLPRKAEVDSKQATSRGAVRARMDTLKRDLPKVPDEDPSHRSSVAVVNRLRELAEAGNEAITAARIVP